MSSSSSEKKKNNDTLTINFHDLARPPALQPVAPNISFTYLPAAAYNVYYDFISDLITQYYSIAVITAYWTRLYFFLTVLRAAVVDDQSDTINKN